MPELHAVIQSNLSNPTLQGTAELCWITEDVRLSRYLHNPTLASMSDHTVNLQYYNFTVEYKLYMYLFIIFVAYTVVVHLIQTVMINKH